MQLFCRNCLEQVSDGDTSCPNCGDESLPLQKYEELSYEQKKIVLKNVKVNKTSTLKFVLTFFVVNAVVLALLYMLRLRIGLFEIHIFYIVPYMLFTVFMGRLVDKTAAMGELEQAKIYSVGAKKCNSLGLVLWFMLMMYDMLTE